MIRRVATLLFVSAMALRAQGPARDVAPIKTGAKVDVAIGTGVIRGRVLAAATGEPLRKARVSISSDAGEHDPVFSDNDGRFELIGLQAGRHTLSAAKAGYVTTKFGARRLIDRATPVEVADGSVIEHIEIRLPRGAAINGHVVDDLGDPLVDQSVTAGRVVHTGGRATFVQSGSAGRTDDLGEYRISGLPAGTYVVSVSSTPGPMANDFRVIITSGFRVAGGTVLAGGSDSLRNTGWARTYYPGATSLSAAQPITVRVGEEAEAIDFAV